jgi:hypothetical protein
MACQTKAYNPEPFSRNPTDPFCHISGDHPEAMVVGVGLEPTSISPACKTGPFAATENRPNGRVACSRHVLDRKPFTSPPDTGT